MTEVKLLRSYYIVTSNLINNNFSLKSSQKLHNKFCYLKQKMKIKLMISWRKFSVSFLFSSAFFLRACSLRVDQPVLDVLVNFHILDLAILCHQPLLLKTKFHNQDLVTTNLRTFNLSFLFFLSSLLKTKSKNTLNCEP